MRPSNRTFNGFRDVQQPQAQVSQEAVSAGISAAIKSRFDRVDELLEWGEPYWLPVDLGISPGAAAGSTRQVVTNNQDFDLLIIGAHSTLYKSSVTILDSSRNKLLTNGAVQLSSIASYAAGSVIVQPWNWSAPYLLPAKAILSITVTADGTEQGGTLVFRCIQPPVTY